MKTEESAEAWMVFGKRSRIVAAITLLTAAELSEGCGQAPRQDTASGSTAAAGDRSRFVVPLTADDRSDAARAAYHAAEAAKYRAIATHDRQLSAAYARWTPPATATKNWNAILKARVDARAVAADQIAAGIEVEANFHAAAAVKGGAQ